MSENLEIYQAAQKLADARAKTAEAQADQLKAENQKLKKEKQETKQLIYTGAALLLLGISSFINSETDEH